jgi:hypothetical protein
MRHVHIDLIDIDDGPTFDETCLSRFLVTFFRFADPVMDSNILTIPAAPFLTLAPPRNCGPKVSNDRSSMNSFVRRSSPTPFSREDAHSDNA